MHKIDEMLLLSLEGEHEKAWLISEELEKLGPDMIPNIKGNPDFQTSDIWSRHLFNRGWHLLQKGEFQKGMQLLENGRWLSTYGNPPLYTDKPIFNPEVHSIEGKSIIISLEGGYGDEVIFAKFAKNYKELGFSKVYLACAPELVSLFSRIEGVDKVILRNEAHTVDHDYWVPGFSSAWIAGVTYDTLSGKPFLIANSDSVNIWKEFLKTDKKIKVGLRWAGNPKFEHQQFRTFPTEFLFQMQQAFPEIQFYSFQRDANVEKIPEGIVDLQHLLLSWEDTAAAISEMDLMISSCTSVAHVSAALGKETCVIVPILPYHVWTYGAADAPGMKGSSDSKWYDSVTLFRQYYKNKWNDTFKDLYAHVEARFGITRSIELKDCDDVVKRLNMGCGFNKHEGYVNADRSSICKPDVQVDFEVYPWPFKDNEFNAIVAKDILEHLRGDFTDVIKEMYRVSKNGAIWEIQVPHHRSDLAIDDPTHVRLLTAKTFRLFDRVECKRLIDQKFSESYFAFECGVDIGVVEAQYKFTDHWLNKLRNKEITEEQLYEALNFSNNVAESTILLIQVHKPVRVNDDEV